jgi:hypothetical protein
LADVFFDNRVTAGLGMTKDKEKEEEYLLEAEEAHAWASRAMTDRAKAAWLRIAQSWLSLLRGAPVEKEAFDRLSKLQGTNQEDSKASH